MSHGLLPGLYTTKAGSEVSISGKSGGMVSIDFDWLEEGACPDSYFWVEEGHLCWDCDCCSDSGSTQLIKMDD